MRAATQQWSPLVAALGLTGRRALLRRRLGRRLAAVARRRGDRARARLRRDAAAAGRARSRSRRSALLAVWSALSVAWSIEPDRSWAYANRGLVYLAFALVGAFAADRLKELMLGLAAILGAVCVWSLAGKVLPWLYEDYGRDRPPARADRLLERARAARRRSRCRSGSASRRAARCRGRCSSTAGSSRSR